MTSGPSSSTSRGDFEATRSMQMHTGPAATPSDGGRPGLVLLYAPEYEQMRPAYVFGAQELILGRDPRADVPILGAAASRLHARICEDDGCWSVADLGARNGTIVNGDFTRKASLAHLDQIRVGDAIFQFVERGVEPYAHYRIDGAYLGDPTPGAARPQLPFSRIIGGYQIQRLAAGLREVAKSALNVLILGETGTGKEVFAEQLHDWSGGRGPFQAVNCAAIAPTLIEGELFGHRRGAFSGADRDRPGLIRAAHGGTLFLDEIGDMPLEAQAKLLRVIQSKEVTPLGSNQPERVDVRIVGATHRDLTALQRTGAFRADLFARLNEYSLTLPPLRHRKEDTYCLCLALATRHGRPEVKVTTPFMAGLLHHDFPYNVRELEALIKRWAAVTRGPEIGVEHFSDEIRERMRTYGRRGSSPVVAQPPSVARGVTPGAATLPVPPAPSGGRAPSEQDLRDLLAKHGGNVAAVAREFGKDRTQIHRWMRRYGIKVDEYR
ncbi:MAG TPA: sigma 54-interacting transcriptional regulator [Candidatus Nanopelagicales bacterium]|nr:sigma 54-interacting transcriptional regulator [Candidatus Nanopelagicales bacterium]